MCILRLLRLLKKVTLNSVSTCLKMHSETISVPEKSISMIFPNVRSETILRPADFSTVRTVVFQAFNVSLNVSRQMGFVFSSFATVSAGINSFDFPRHFFNLLLKFGGTNNTSLNQCSACWLPLLGLVFIFFNITLIVVIGISEEGIPIFGIDVAVFVFRSSIGITLFFSKTFNPEFLRGVDKSIQFLLIQLNFHGRCSPG